MADYLYEQLNDETFQQLCQALLVKLFPNVQCLPVGQPDGGRDAMWIVPNRDIVVYQVKFVRNPSRIEEPHKWLSKTAAKEVPGITRLVPRGAKAYYLLTNVPGTAHLDSGSIDIVNSTLSENLAIPAYCWWRDDINRRLDGQWDIKWRYPDILSGPDVLRAVFQLGINEERARRESAIRAFISQQLDNDREVKFKQIELQNDLLDLFVDVPAAVQTDTLSDRDTYRIRNAMAGVAERTGAAWRGDSRLNDVAQGVVDPHEDLVVGAAHLLLDPLCADVFPRMVLEGAPGQGKSTLAQFACQIHRLRLLRPSTDFTDLPAALQRCPLRLPIKVDLRDYGTWLARRDPFDLTSETPDGWKKSLEAFVAHLITHLSGGVDFTVADLHAIARVSSLLLILDALDEVADVSIRNDIVGEVTAGVRRLEAVAASLQTVVTSRPANFSNSPGFSEKQFRYFQLAQLPRPLIDEYTEKWIHAKRLDQKDSTDVRRVMSERLSEPHLRDLARNPMQLAILLSVVHTRGVSLPDKRTALYNLYMEYFFNREAEKDASVRAHRELLLDIHGYLAWLLQSEAEKGGSSGRISLERLREVLRTYLEQEGEPQGLVDELFRDVVQRVFALVARVQGTFEFEVQPLREYFAARYLYETAPPSPPGEERTGSKPDRFDAIARNFYWLNVTRFYAGFYNKGELPSLVEQLQVLAEQEDYRDIRHPRLVAAMLLSDWVFSQNKRAMRSIVELVLDGLGVHSALVGSGVSAITDPIRLPEGNGRHELVERCFALLLKLPPPDYAWELCVLLVANTSKPELATHWMGHIVKMESNERTTWLEYATGLQLMSSLTFEQIDLAIQDDPLNAERLMMLALGGRVDYCDSDEARREVVIESILDHPALHHHARSASGPLGFLLAFRQWSLLRIALCPGFEDASVHENLAHDYRVGIGFDAMYLVEAPPGYGAIGEYVATFRSALGRPAREWAHTLEPWVEVIETGRKLWGDRRAFAYDAVVSAGIRSRVERGTGYEDLLDHSLSLARRIRYARLQSGNPSWWRQQAQLAEPTTYDAFLVCLVALCWCTGRTLSEVRDEIDWLLRSASQEEFAVVAAALAAIEPVRKIDREFAGTVLDGMPDPSARLVAVSGRRSGPASWKGLYEQYLSIQLPTEHQVLQFCLSAVAEEPPSDDGAWREVLRVAEVAYSAGAGFFAPWRPTETFASSMPIELARSVTKRADRFPRAIVGFAQERCRQAVAAQVLPVADVAEAERWFGAG